MTPVIKMLSSDMSHMPLQFVWEESGVSEKHGFTLKVDVANTHLDGQPFIGMKERGRVVLEGDYQFLSGLHHEPYMYRARGDKRFVYLAQAQNDWDDRLLVTSEIETASDLNGGRIMVNTAAPCVLGNLKHVLEMEGADIDTIDFFCGELSGGDRSARGVEAVVAGEAIAANVDLPFDLQGEKQGLHVLPLPNVPVIHNTTICTNNEWVKANPEMVDAFLRSLVDAIHYFKTHRDESLEILERRFAPVAAIKDYDELEYLHTAWSELLSAKPYPHPLAVWNVYNLDVAHHPEFNFVGPFDPWDTSYLKAIDDEGYIDNLYGGAEFAINAPVTAVI